jgi:hypothetical protein
MIGIDGEGKGRRPHRYTYLAAADADGQAWDTRGESLGTAQCLDLILSLPGRALIAAFAFNYDLTKILADLPNESLWLLFHERSRQRIIKGRTVYKSVRWGPYRLNYVNRRFSVAMGKRRRTVWDFFRFFQCSFVRALAEWKIADTAAIDVIAAMKDQRSIFDTVDNDAIEAYCRSECVSLAKLGRALLDAHEAADLKLKVYNGPGSTASVLLSRHGIADRRGTYPAAMRLAIAAAFFGGRFENSRIGRIPGPVYARDLASAYPYAATFLPCLEHGRWKYVRRPKLRAIERADLALIHWSGGTTVGAWGALPVRAENGSIVFPLAGDGGWTWKPEYMQAIRFPGARYEVSDAWLYHSDCECKPFSFLPDVYRERCRLGKDGPGRVLKLGSNSVPGKLMQSVGVAPFRSWIWGGMITSSTRAELLKAILLAADPWDVVMLATDGLYATADLTLPPPLPTGTADCRKSDGTLAPLGMWESKTVAGGVFAARPGIYFPLDPAADPDEAKARGLGRKILVERRADIMAALDSGAEHNGCDPAKCSVKGPHVELSGMQRFVGAKSGLQADADFLASGGRVGSVARSADYGEWVPHSIRLTFNPGPKRWKRQGGRLLPFARTAWESFAYSEAERSPESEALGMAEETLLEQPDGDFLRDD